MAEKSKGGWQGMLRRAPRWVVGLVTAIALTALQLGMRLLTGKEVEAEHVAATGVFGLAGAALALWLSGRTRAKERKLPPGSPTATNMIRHCMGEGDAEAEVRQVDRNNHEKHHYGNRCGPRRQTQLNEARQR